MGFREIVSFAKWCRGLLLPLSQDRLSINRVSNDKITLGFFFAFNGEIKIKLSSSFLDTLKRDVCSVYVALVGAGKKI